MHNLEKYTLNSDNSVSPEKKKPSPIVVALVFLFSCFTDTVLFGTNLNNNFVLVQRFVIIAISLCLFYFTRKRSMIGQYAKRNNYSGYAASDT